MSALDTLLGTLDADATREVTDLQPGDAVQIVYDSKHAADAQTLTAIVTGRTGDVAHTLDAGRDSYKRRALHLHADGRIERASVKDYEHAGEGHRAVGFSRRDLGDVLALLPADDDALPTDGDGDPRPFALPHGYYGIVGKLFDRLDAEGGQPVPPFDITAGDEPSRRRSQLFRARHGLRWLADA